MTNAARNETLETILAGLTAPRLRQQGKQYDILPSWTATQGLLDDLHKLLLVNLDEGEAREKLWGISDVLRQQIEACATPVTAGDDAMRACEAFMLRLPAVRETLQEDVRAVLRNDPAATCPAEVTLCYPGLRALTCYRVAHLLHRLDVPLLPRLMTEIGHSQTGIDIHPGACIGRRFFIDHGTGVVIGETCIIGDDVKIYQGVTLGARSFPVADNGEVIRDIARHPVIGDRVTIYAGATILGRIRIGDGSVIGGNVWITRDVPDHSNIRQRRPHSDN